MSQTEEERLRAAGSSAGVSEPTVTRLAAHSAGSILALVASTPDASGAGDKQGRLLLQGRLLFSCCALDLNEPM